MNRGRKLSDPANKKLAGTFKNSVDGATAPIVQVAADIPIAPVWLSDGAKEVWEIDLPRVVACGATAVDSHFFAIYCTNMADFIARAKAGDPTNAAFSAEMRKTMEMLGITGAKSRLARMAQPAQTGGKPSPFTVRKR